MAQVSLNDLIDASDRKVTEEGYLQVKAKISRTGIQMYSGPELGIKDKTSVKVYRPPDEVFHADSMLSFAGKPITNDHPKTPVTSKNFREVSVGMSMGDVTRTNDDHLQVTLVVTDEKVVKSILEGKDQLSNGYTCELALTPGTTPSGETYDAIQTRIRGNHIAFVDAARCGPTCRIGDSCDGKCGASCHCKEEPDMPGEIKLVPVLTADGLTIETTDQAATYIRKLLDDLKTLNTSLGTKDGDLVKLKADHAADLAKKDGEIAGLKTQIPTAAALDAMATERANLVVIAKKIIGDTFQPGALTGEEIKKAVVVAKLGAAVVDGKSADYITGVYTTLASGLTTSTADGNQALAAALAAVQTNGAGGPGQGGQSQAAATAMTKRNADLSDAWKGGTA